MVRIPKPAHKVLSPPAPSAVPHNGLYLIVLLTGIVSKHGLWSGSHWAMMCLQQRHMEDWMNGGESLGKVKAVRYWANPFLHLKRSYPPGSKLPALGLGEA